MLLVNYYRWWKEKKRFRDGTQQGVDTDFHIHLFHCNWINAFGIIVLIPEFYYWGVASARRQSGKPWTILLPSHRFRNHSWTNSLCEKSRILLFRSKYLDKSLIFLMYFWSEPKTIISYLHFSLFHIYNQIYHYLRCPAFESFLLFYCL